MFAKRHPTRRRSHCSHAAVGGTSKASTASLWSLRAGTRKGLHKVSMTKQDQCKAKAMAKQASSKTNKQYKTHWDKLVQQAMEKNKQGKYKRASAYYKGVRFVHRNYAAIGTTGGIIAFYILVRALPYIAFFPFYTNQLPSYDKKQPRISLPDEKHRKTYMKLHSYDASGSNAIVYFHGNGETAQKTDVPYVLNKLYNFEYKTVFCPEYCGYPGTSCIRPTEKSCYESAEYAAKYLTSESPYFNPNVQKLIVCGWSLGCAMAIHFATLPVVRDKIHSVVLFAPFESVSRVVIPRHIYPAFRHLDIFKNGEKICNIPTNIPIKILSGDKDQVILKAHLHGQRLQSKGGINCKYKTLEECDHGFLFACFDKDGLNKVGRTIRDFLSHS